MLPIILFIICLAATSIGAIVGASGGIIIKPVLDMFQLMPSEVVSFYSGCTVLCMSLSSLYCTRHSGVELEVKTSTPLAIGAVLGGLVGRQLLEMVSKSGSSTLGGIQAVCLVVITTGILLYVIYKHRLRSLHVQNRWVCLGIGICLGIIPAFLGIGGGPVNVAVLYFFFSMEAKQAARNSIYIIVFSQIANITSAFLKGTVPEISWLPLFSMAVGGVSGALAGAAVSRHLSNKGVETAFQCVLAVIIAINIYNVINFFFVAG
jgi:uncharacterized membrane protein YfcA